MRPGFANRLEQLVFGYRLRASGLQHSGETARGGDDFGAQFGPFEGGDAVPELVGEALDRGGLAEEPGEETDVFIRGGANDGGADHESPAGFGDDFAHDFGKAVRVGGVAFRIDGVVAGFAGEDAVSTRVNEALFGTEGDFQLDGKLRVDQEQFRGWSVLPIEFANGVDHPFGVGGFYLSDEFVFRTAGEALVGGQDFETLFGEVAMHHMAEHPAVTEKEDSGGAHATGLEDPKSRK